MRQPGIDGYVDAVEIGRGGFAVVYRARRTALDQIVAVKVLHAADLDAVALARFDRERIAMGALAHHPHIVTVYDGGTTPQGTPYLVMEYVQGGSLADELRRSGPLRPERVLDIGVHLAGAVETAHRAGVLHRDIKPDNVLVSRYGQPLLADFGISRIRGGHRTETGVITASIVHAPPEVLDGKPPSVRSDVYSLASTLYCLLSGHPPFVRPDDDSALAAVARVFRDPVPEVAGVPAPVLAALRDGMAKDPTHRPATALDLAERLRAVQRALGLAPATPAVEGAARSAATVESSAQPQVALPTQVGPVPAPSPAFPTRRLRRTGHRRLLAAAMAVLVIVAVVGVVILVNGAGSGGPVAAPPVVPVAADVDLGALLLPFSALGPGAGMLPAPSDDVAIVGPCPRQGNRTGLRRESATILTSPPGAQPKIHVYSHVAQFTPDAAAGFLASIRDAAVTCASGSGLVRAPERLPPPAGADETVRVQGDTEDLIWARRGDLVVLVHVIFFNDPAASHADIAPDLAAKAVDTVIRGTS